MRLSRTFTPMPSAPPAAMTEPTWHRTHLSVPRADETLLAIPTLDAAADAARSNAEILAAAEVDVQGKDFVRLRAEARGEAVRLARAFTRNILGDSVASADLAAPLVVPGHQPALYHPGVWAKNFAAAGIAERLGGSVLNLIVDNDIYSRPAIDVPAGTRAEPRKEGIQFDVPQRPRPWERTAVKDIATFRAFSGRVANRMRTWHIQPVVEQAWQAASERATLGGSVPECLSVARHAVEADWGLHNLELPMSRLCESDPFLRFASHLLAQLPRFVDVYNGVLAEYRRLYRLKSRNHPVPPLEGRGDWLEAPLWVWRDDAPNRRRVFALLSGKQTSLADDTGRVFATLPLSPTMDACCAVEVLRSLPSQGIRLRSRALTTTLFARLFLADTFVHGVGGAKYDEMTDRIIARFFGLTVPAYATVSASLYLPFAAPFDVAAEDERRLVALLRDLDRNPQRHLSGAAESDVARLIEERAALVTEQDSAEASRGLTRKQRRDRAPANARRFGRLREITTLLSGAVQGQRERVEADLAVVRKELRANRTLASREFSFVLYPEDKLRPFLTALARSRR